MTFSRTTGLDLCRRLLGVLCKPQAELLVIFIALLTIPLLEEKRATDTSTLILTKVEELLVTGTWVSSRWISKKMRGVLDRGAGFQIGCEERYVRIKTHTWLGWTLKC